MDLSKLSFVCSKEEMQKERDQAYAVFYETMKSINPSLSESIIQESFARKFSA